MLNRKRQELHALIAVTIEREQPELAAQQPEVVARHFSEANLPDKAVPFWLKAADRLVLRYAVAETVDTLIAATADLKRMATGETCDRLCLDVAMRLAQARYLQGRFEEAIDSLMPEELRLVRLADPAVTGSFRFWLAHMNVRIGLWRSRTSCQSECGSG